ncbi:MAG: protein kinase, partial [Acidobacteriota bacterium]
EPAIQMAARELAENQVNSMIGRQLAHYKIVSLLGAGGMGEVYRATDTQLERDVAIKVLPVEFSQDEERLARFEREAKLLAAFNHPNIATIHGLEESDGIRFLVLELVEGQTLAERLIKGPLPIEKALEICHQITEGLEAAHAKGVIHRDLKPANVKITPQGKVKVLDFGLAKAFEGATAVTDLSQQPTLTDEMTRTGVILGTAAYMSPEQAQGQPADRRTDVWALGCLLYELLTGQPTFPGETITEIVAAVLKSDPSWERLPENTPGLIRFLLRRCLDKNSDDRFHDIADVRVAIGDALKELTTVSPSVVTTTTHPGRWRWAVPLVVLGALAASLLTWILMPSSSPVEQQVQRFVISPEATAPLHEDYPFSEVAVSSDGSKFVYVAETETGSQLYLRSLDDFEARPISGTESTANYPMFSPDGESIAFVSSGQLKRVSVQGGAPRVLFDLEGNWGGGSWLEDTIVFVSERDLFSIPANGGEAELLTTAPEAYPDEFHFSEPQILPGGKSVLLQAGRSSPQIAVYSLETGQLTNLLPGGISPRYASAGYVIYLFPGTGKLMAAPFDLQSLEITGEPVPVLEGVRFSRAPVGAGFGATYALSPGGTLVYVLDPGSYYRLLWVDRTGGETLAAPQKRGYRGLNISPDGKRVLMSLGPSSGFSTSTEIYDLEGDSFSRIPTEGITSAIWTRDGQWITYQALVDRKSNLYRQRADRSAAPEQLTHYTDTRYPVPTSWSPDGRILLYKRQEIDSIFIDDILSVDIQASEGPQDLIAGPGNQTAAQFSPDGNWIAYVSDETGENQVWVCRYPEIDRKWLVSDGEVSVQPKWSRDGSELFYRNGNKTMAVSIQTESGFRADRPQLLFEGSYRTDSRGLPRYDVSPDGRFLVVSAQDTEVQIHVVLNWFKELKRLVPVN